MLATPPDSLYKVISSLNLIDPKKLSEALAAAKRQNLPLEDVLVKQDLISDENLGRVVADMYSMPFIRLSKITIDPQILKIVPQVVAKKQKLIVFSKDSNGLKVATNNPQSLEIFQFISKKTGEKINLYYATSRDINDAVANYEKGIQKSFEELLANAAKSATEGHSPEAPVAKIVDLLIAYAYDNKASDIHIEPLESETLVRFRIDGVLHDVLNLPRSIHDQIISRIKVLSKLRTDEHLNAQDGKMQAKLEEEDLDLRVSIVPVVKGEKAVLRLLSAVSRQFTLSNLGMGEVEIEKVKNGFGKSYGMVLATGPTGSGKTTTIYAILKVINTRDKNISTIEDPVEYDIEGINQIQVNNKTNLTFANGLRSILRQDPNVIYVGEIRDNETAGIAINSAMTGHLVLSTMHTNDAATTLPRLLDMEIEPFLVASTVNVIIGQRLVRKICEKCRTSVSITADKLEKHISSGQITKHFGFRNDIRIYQGKGCAICHFTGYSGRIGLFEVLEVTESIKELISSKANSSILAKKAIEEGMTAMMDDGLKKVAIGLTTLEEILRATKE